MFRRFKRFIFASSLLLLSACALFAQQDDAGLWTSVGLKHQITRRLSVSLAEQFRFHQNMSELDQFFTDVGLDYDLLKSLKVSVNYRIISKNRLTYYSTRHRSYIDLAYKVKLKPFTIGLRQRIQNEVRDINSSDYGKVPEWYSRTKLSVKLDLNKKYTPYVSTEYFYIIDNFKEQDHVFDKDRYEIGVDYDFNRRSSLNLFYLIQKDILQNKTRDFVSGLGYSYSF